MSHGYQHAVVVRKFSAALVVLRCAAFIESKQTDDDAQWAGYVVQPIVLHT